MAFAASRAGSVGWRVALVVSILLCSGVEGADVLFPLPLHLTRRISDPIANATIEVEEYCVGNRVITVRGDRVVIVDYDQQQVTDIDHADRTYSVTRFDEIARANGAERSRGVDHAPAASQSATIVSLGPARSASNRDVERFTLETAEGVVGLSVDHGVSVSRAALDVLLGAAYPNRPVPYHGHLVRAATRSRGREVKTDVAATESYGLPADQATTWQVEGQTVTLRSVVTRVGDEFPAPSILSIPAGARRVESRATTVPRFAEELDRGLPSSNQ